MGTQQDLNLRSNVAGGYIDDRDADAIKRDIDHTRSRMDATLDALSARLRPRNLVNEALGWAGYETRRSPAAQDTVQSFLTSVGLDLLHSFRDSAKDASISGAKCACATGWRVARKHPLPSAVIGAGVAWLAYEAMNGPTMKARLKGWKLYNPEPEYGGSYVDARTGRPYHEENYGGDHGIGDLTPPGPTISAPIRRSRYDVTPTPEPTYGGSYVDARTGEAYDPNTYGQEAKPMSYDNPNAGDFPSTPAGASAPGMAGRARDTMHHATDSVRGGAHRLADAARVGAHYVSDTAHSAADSMRHGATSAAHSLTHSASSAAHYVSGTGRSAIHQVRSGYDYSRERTTYAVENYPLAVGAVALGLGVLIGLAIPRTRREEELLGERARQVRERARAAGQEMVDRGRRAARETVAAVTDEVERQGLTPSSLGDTVRGLASRIVEDVKHDAEEAGLTVDSMKDKAKQVATRARETARSEVAGADTERHDEPQV